MVRFLLSLVFPGQAKIQPDGGWGNNWSDIFGGAGPYN
jgi:hypothetical protein